MPSEMKVPTVSVIIPTFNRAWTLSSAIDSVLAQSFQDFELIIVDDGSTDNTNALLTQYGDTIQVLPQANRGVSAARNRGIHAARGRLIAFLDSDDEWMPEKLAVQVEFFKQNPTLQICQTEEIWIRKGQHVNPKKRHKKPAGDIFKPSLHLCLVSPSAVMLRRALFERVGFFDEALPACEDYDMWLRISCHYPVGLIDTPLIIKRGGHADQLSRMAGLDQYRIQSIVKLMESGHLSDNQKQAAVAVLVEKCRIYANGCRKRDKFEEADYFEDLARRYATDSHDGHY